jgi:translation initiation factor IF-3
MRRPTQTGRPVEQGPRVNEKIREAEVRLIDGEGGQVGVVTIEVALRMAQEASLDLVEVSPQAVPPVCRLIDYGKYKYQLSKKAQEAKKKQAVVEVKEVNLTPNTDSHDIETKQNHIRKWVADKNRVKVSVKFRGREMAHQELGYRVIDELLKGLDDIVAPESRPRFEGRRLTVTLLPKSEVKSAEPKPTAVPSPSSSSSSSSAAPAPAARPKEPMPEAAEAPVATPR